MKKYVSYTAEGEIYRPCPPKTKFYRKKHRRRTIAAIVLCVFLFVIGAALYFQHNVTRVLISISEATMRAHTTVAINDAIYYTLSDGVRYEDLVTVSRDAEGAVTSVSANALKINKIARDAASISQSNLKNLSLNGVPVPLGALTGIRRSRVSGRKYISASFPSAASPARSLRSSRAWASIRRNIRCISTSSRTSASSCPPRRKISP